MNQQSTNQKYLDDYEGSGPRPPVPGRESRIYKMTDSGHHQQQQQQQQQPQQLLQSPYHHYSSQHYPQQHHQHHHHHHHDGHKYLPPPGDSILNTAAPSTLSNISSSSGNSGSGAAAASLIAALPSNPDYTYLGETNTIITNNNSNNNNNNNNVINYRLSPPPYAKWGQELKNLLEDAEGAELFKRFVESEGGIHADRLKFYFACEGLKQQTDDYQIKKLVRVIYKFLSKSELSITPQLRDQIKYGQLHPNIFDQMQSDVFHSINDTTYPNFFQSELYTQYINQVVVNQQNSAAAISSSSSSSSIAGGSGGGGGGGGGGGSAPCGTPPIISSMGSLSIHQNVPRSSTLPTLHEDTELSMQDSLKGLIHTSYSYESTTPTTAGFLSLGGLSSGPSTLTPPLGGGGGGGGSSTMENPHMRLTRDLLLKTQERRLDVRPQGAHGYIANFSSSYNPVSRQDSERQSCSSGGKTDSEKMSSSRDGRPHYRRQTGERDKIQQNAQLNKDTNPYVTPRTARVNEMFRPPNQQELISLLIPKLDAIKRDREREDKLDKTLNEDKGSLSEGGGGGSGAIGGSGGAGSSNSSQYHRSASGFCGGQALTDAIFRKLQVDDDNDQSILDQHVSRVWSDLTPHRSPGTISPGPEMLRRRSHIVETGLCIIGGESSSSSATNLMGGQLQHQQSLRHTHNLGDGSGAGCGSSSGVGGGGVASTSSSSRRQSNTNKWSSFNTDSGISTYSLDGPSSKFKDTASNFSTASLVEEARRRLEDESSRKPRRYSQNVPLPPSLMQQQQQQQQHQHQQQHLPLQSHHQMVQQLAPPPPPITNLQESTTAIYSFLDEVLPYRSKLPGLRPTLKQFKDFLPKKGNFRFFFKTACEDPDNPVIQEEIVNDSEILPLFDGKVMGLVKPYE